MKKLLFVSTFLLSVGSFSQTDLGFGGTGSVISPASGCQLSSSSIIQIIVGNASTTTPYYGTFDISYSLNGSPLVTESVTLPATSPIMPAVGSYTKNFVNQADLSACQIHNITFILDVPGDVNPLNDTLHFAVTSDCPPTVGSISGPATVCTTGNSGSFTLTGFNGNIDHWEYSIDNTTWTTSANTSATENFTNISQPTWYRVVVNSPYGYCAPDTTASFYVDMDVPSIGGTASSDISVCSGSNNGYLTVSGNNGNVINWAFSTDGGSTWSSTGMSNDTLFYNNVSLTTQYVAVVQNGSCPPDSSTAVTVTVIPGSNGGIVNGGANVCIGNNSGTLDVTGFNGTIISWISSTDGGNTWTSTGNNSTSQPYSNLNVTTIYAVVVQEGSCPADTSSFGSIVVSSSPLISAGPDAIIVQGDSIQLQGSGGVSYSWSPTATLSNAFIPNPFASPGVTTTYTLTAVDNTGCTGVDQVTITVVSDMGIIANLISPNGDGKNDSWYIQNIHSFPESEVSVFNQYGKIIFQAAPYNNDWEGTYNGDKLPNGTYFYVVRYSPDTDPVKGSLTIMNEQ